MLTPDGHCETATVNSDSYTLTVTFVEGKLNIILNNYQDESVYEETFTQENIGKDIDRKLELADVFSCFCQEENKQEMSLKKKQGIEIKQESWKI